MNSRITELLEEIRAREQELEDLVSASEEKILYRFEGSKVRFEKTVHQAQQRFRVGVLRWLRQSRPRNVPGRR